MADQGDYEDGTGDQQTPQRRQYQQLPQRSTASSNWRMKDDSPRAEPQPRVRGDRQGGAFNSPRAYNSQAREASDTRLYVGNLLYSATKNDIAQFFSDNGFNPTNLTMSVDPETGRNPSYCFVDFETADEASRAISELNGLDLLGRSVRISPGVARRQGSGQGDSPAASRSYGSPRGWAQDRQQSDGARSYSSYNNRSSADNHNSAPTEGKKLYIGSLPNLAHSSPDDVERSIRSLFDQLGISLSYVSKLIAPHESKASEPGDHHYCFVELENAGDVERAIESLDGKPSPWSEDGTGLLRVNRAREQRERRQGGGFGGDRNQGGYRERRTEGFGEWRGRGEGQ